MADLFGSDEKGQVKPIRKTRAKPLGKEEDAQAIWDDWVKRQKCPENCIFTVERMKMLRERLGLGYQAQHLIAVIRWVFEADVHYARFLRGENDRNTAYTDLENIFRIQTLGARVQLALDWAKEQDDEPPTEVRQHASGLTLILGVSRKVKR
jgi:hypothetical protein